MALRRVLMTTLCTPVSTEPHVIRAGEPPATFPPSQDDVAAVGDGSGCIAVVRYRPDGTPDPDLNPAVLRELLHDGGHRLTAPAEAVRQGRA